MYDWDGNRRIDPHDIGQSISMGLYDEKEQNVSPKRKDSTGCLPVLLTIIVVLISVNTIH